MHEHRDGTPLTSTQLEAIIDVARDMGFRYRLIAEVIPHTGLTFTEFCHLREEWLRRTDPTGNRLNIKVPLASPCAGTLRVEQSGRQLEVLEEPCWLCREDGEWTPPGECRHRTIPVPEPGREALELCFDRIGLDSLPFTVSSNFYKWMDDLAGRAGLSRSFGFKALRRTYGTALIRRGFSSEEVASHLGLHRRTKTRPLYEAMDEPVDWKELPARGKSDEDILEALQRLTSRLGQRPTMTDIDEIFEYSYKPLYNRFGGLHAALDAAGIDVPDEDPQAIAVDNLLAELRRVADELERPPTKSEIDSKGEYSPCTYHRRFGSWDAALDAAGLDPEAPRGNEIPQIDRQTLLKELRRLADELGRPPTQNHVRHEGKFAASTYKRRFEGVRGAREEAGLDHPSDNLYSDEELLDDLQRLATELGHAPVRHEIRELGEYSCPTYRNRFGGLDEARAAAGLCCNE